MELSLGPSLVNQVFQLIKLTFNILVSFPSFLTFSTEGERNVKDDIKERECWKWVDRTTLAFI